MPRPRKYESDAEKQKAYRERNELATLCVQLPVSLVAEFEEWLKFKDKSKSEVVEKLLRSQLLRKR
ncbi:hypothetical protein ACO0LD_05290 [Undibacterium sp. Ji83W]|uniref:hypothetical protein n=1 Tax=Undibacterium sp. Ji83W TaxID=3413043 RepID=UPI003BF09A5A